MKIRTATPSDLDSVFDIYARARAFMKDNGNPLQWGETYPEKEVVLDDLKNGYLYVLESADGSLAGVFAFLKDGDRVYDHIDGNWLNDKPHAAIHRVASNGTQKGIFSEILAFCLTFSDNLKIDTHTNNVVMQHVLKKHGFIECGTVFYDDISLLAFQFSKCD